MADLATVRAEIKAWERSFKESNGRPPTVDDIKQNHAIADKYKQYKKLSKAEAPKKPTQTVNSAASPSTPPRRTRPKEPPSLLLSKSRLVQPSAPLASFNPFSPQKKQQGKGKERMAVDRIDQSLSKPFGKPHATSRDRKPSHSPDPFPSIPSRPSSSASSSNFALNALPVPTTAVSRARKRLRGEPVSPSPNKEKRRRVASQTTLPFPRLHLDAPSSDDGEDDFMEGNSSFVDNSPVKAPTTGKSYTQLFEEDLAPVDLFGVKGNTETKKQDIQEPRNKFQRVSNSTARTKPSTRRASTSRQSVTDPANNNLEHSNVRSTSKLPPRLPDRNSGNSKSEVSSNRSSAKRAFSDEESEDKVDQQPLPRAKSPLIPPSPPPTGTNASFNRPGKGKAKAKGSTSRKKAKLDDGQVDDDSDDLEMHGSQAKLRIVGRNDMRRQHAARPDEDAVTSDSDPILGYARFAAPHVSSQNHVQQEGGDVEINLPDELRRVLALQSVDSKLQVSEEGRLVQGLLYGRRVAHYDPRKGGEIWDVGEDHHVEVDEGHSVNTEGEDDWEGEPVPWEVGEL